VAARGGSKLLWIWLWEWERIGVVVDKTGCVGRGVWVDLGERHGRERGRHVCWVEARDWSGLMKPQT